MKSDLLKIRIQPYVTRDVHDRLGAYCAKRRLTESAVVDRALREHLDGLGDLTLLYRRLTSINKSLRKFDRTLSIVGELLNQFIKAWLRNTPPLPEADNRGNERPARDRYKSLMERLTAAVTSGATFFDALPEEDLDSDEPSEATESAPGAAPRTPSRVPSATALEAKFTQ